jgi:multidrug efflux pump
MMSGGYTGYFVLGGRSYRTMAQVEQRFRLNPDQLLDQYVKTSTGAMVQVGSFARVINKTIPQALPHFQQLNAATISGFPSGALGDTLAKLREIAARTLPDGYLIDYAGQSRQYMQESGSFAITLFLAGIIIFLALAALFESFRDPIIILFSVPLSFAGALIFIKLGIGDASLNIYTKIGILTLAGLISKHGILIVDVANRKQLEGHTKREAVEIAAGMRLRPILMTTAAMVLGVLPLLFASGAGSAARYNMGLVIAAGLSIGTFFTLFVVPAVYTFLAIDHRKLRERQREQQALIDQDQHQHEAAE